MMKTAAAMLLLTLASPAIVQGQVTAIRATGEHRPAAGDTADSARRLALVDARQKAWQEAVTRLSGRSDLKALGLERTQVEAYVAVILETEEQPSAGTASARGPVRVGVRASLDAEATVRRMAALRADQDASYQLLESWSQLQRLQQQLAAQSRARATRPATEASAIVRDQLQLVDTLDAKLLAARAVAALARTEHVTVGGRAPSDEGRQRARALAEAALALAPGLPDAHSVLGDLFVDARQPEAAEAELRKALERDADNSLLRTKLAEAVRLQGRFPESVTELREVIRLAPTFARAHSDLGMVLRAQDNAAEAIAEYQEALRLDPDWVDAHNGLAVTLASQGRFDEAIAGFREIIRIDPDSAIGYYNLAFALAEADRDIESAAALREVIRINPNHYNARFNLGELFRLEGKYDDSATQFREYLKLAPDTPQNQRNIQRARSFIEKFGD